MLKFSFGNKTFVLSDVLPFTDEWFLFRSDSDTEPDISIKVIIERKGSESCYHNMHYCGGFCNLFVDRSTSDYLVADEKWKECEIHSLEPRLHHLNGLCFLAACSAMLYEHAVFVHGALIKWKGRGILFTGPSGIGKSTQADLWFQIEAARILNGDISLVRKDSDRFFGYSSPWHGTSPYCLNESVPLHAIIALEQSKNNQLERLTGNRMIEKVLSNVIMPRWLSGFLPIVLDVTEELIQQVPVYLLKNKADIQSVSLLADELLKGIPDEVDRID